MIDTWFVVYLVLLGSVAGLAILFAWRPRPLLVMARSGPAGPTVTMTDEQVARHWRRWGRQPLGRWLDPAPAAHRIEHRSQLVEHALSFLPVDGVRPRFLALPCALRRVRSNPSGNT
jgi:hypothetical protein